MICNLTHSELDESLDIRSNSGSGSLSSLGSTQSMVYLERNEPEEIADSELDLRQIGENPLPLQNPGAYQDLQNDGHDSTGSHQNNDCPIAMESSNLSIFEEHVWQITIYSPFTTSPSSVLSPTIISDNHSPARLSSRSSGEITPSLPGSVSQQGNLNDSLTFQKAVRYEPITSPISSCSGSTSQQPQHWNQHFSRRFSTMTTPKACTHKAINTYRSNTPTATNPNPGVTTAAADPDRGVAPAAADSHLGVATTATNPDPGITTAATDPHPGIAPAVTNPHMGVGPTATNQDPGITIAAADPNPGIAIGAPNPHSGGTPTATNSHPGIAPAAAISDLNIHSNSECHSHSYQPRP